MSLPLLETKLFLPSPRPGLVRRDRLRDRLAGARGATVVLVSAPAGFGKTTVLVQWLASLGEAPDGGPRAAWLALDAADNDPVRFWRYVVAAVQRAVPGVGHEALALLQEPQPPPAELMLTSLINDLGAVRSDVLLVLDDYHVIDSAVVHAGLQFLVEHLPPRLRLVLAGRTDPALPLSRMRARGDLVEVRAADLRFTAGEVADYLSGAMGLELASSEVGALEERTEGWIAALQLAALSMAGRDDVSGFVASFAGDDRYVVDYLVEEVMQRQPPEVVTFLLQTSVLDRMTGDLCDAVTGQGGGRAVLEMLDRDNLFVVRLDDRRQWYRYHHLFADVLRSRLLDEQPGQVGRLHGLACDWHEHHGDVAEAIGHAVAGGDVTRAAGLVEQVMPGMRRDRREATLRAWLEALPIDVIRRRPVLANALAGARMSTGTFDGVEELLVVAERLIERAGGAAASADVVVVDRVEYSRLPAEVAVHRAGLALVTGRTKEAVRHARGALDVALDDDHLSRGAASALIGLAAWSTGDLETARRLYAACLVEFTQIDHVADVLGCTITLADIEIAQGRLRDSLRSYRAALDLADRHPTPVWRGRADMHVGIAARHRELGDLEGARRHLALGGRLGEHAGLPQDAYRWRTVTAQVCEAAGDLDAAWTLLDEAERLYQGDFSPDVRPVAALRARLQARHGLVDEAARWVDRRGLSMTEDLDYLYEYEHVTLARVLIARHLPDDATALLERLLQAATDGRRDGSVIDVRIAQALAHRVAGDTEAALAALRAGLDLAAPEGYLRTFVDEGAPMAELLAKLAQREPSAYVARLLVALGRAPVLSPGSTGGLIDPLSRREREVLRLLDTDLTGPEIARELVVSLNTVRTHTKNVYLKLAVTSRRSAVLRARELGLL